MTGRLIVMALLTFHSMPFERRQTHKPDGSHQRLNYRQKEMVFQYSKGCFVYLFGLFTFFIWQRLLFLIYSVDCFLIILSWVFFDHHSLQSILIWKETTNKSMLSKITPQVSSHENVDFTFAVGFYKWKAVVFPAETVSRVILLTRLSLCESRAGRAGGSWVDRPRAPASSCAEKHRKLPVYSFKIRFKSFKNFFFSSASKQYSTVFQT